MSIQKFRSVSEMSSPPIETDPEKILQKIEFVWSMTSVSPSSKEPRGVRKFRTIDEANEARESFARSRRPDESE